MERKICLDHENYKIVIREDNEEYHFKPHYVLIIGPYDASLVGIFPSSNHAVDWAFVNFGNLDNGFNTHILSQTEMEDNIREYSDIDFYTPEDFIKFLKEATLSE